MASTQSFHCHASFLVLSWACWQTSGVLLNVRNESRYKNAASNSSSLQRCRNMYKSLTVDQLAKFTDASGKPSSGIFGGNTLWYGSYSECEKLPDSRYCFTRFPGRISLIPNKTEVHLFEWGVCVPNVCTSEDVSADFEFFFQKSVNNVTRSPQWLQIKCAEDPEYTASVVVTIVFCGVLIGICLLATFIETFKDFYKPKTSNLLEKSEDLVMGNEPHESKPLLPEVEAKMGSSNEGLLYELLQSFSLARNVKNIMNTSVGKSDLTYLHGIRVITLFWIIIFHVVMEYRYFFPIDNLKEIVHNTRRLSQLPVLQAYGVDTFFVLSGLLVMYTNMGKKVKNNGRTNWFKFYFHRFWRLTPTYMFCILLITKFRPFLGAGPIWFVQSDTSRCSENWWTNLLYLNNFIHVSREGLCLLHTWYLAVDMQLFIISPLFLLVAYRYRLRALVYTVGVFVLLSVIVTACLIADNGEPPKRIAFARLFLLYGNNQDKVMQANDDFLFDVYMKPYCRIPPYAMGMLLGFILHKHFATKLKLSWRIVILGWILATTLALTDIFSPYSSTKEDPRIWTTGEKAIFGSLKWPIWGFCIVWLIFACHYNYAGVIKDILAAKFWIPLSRINYSAFIIHYDVIRTLVYNIESPIHATSFTTATYFLAALVLTYAIAFIITLFVEFPFANLEAFAWKKWEKK